MRYDPAIYLPDAKLRARIGMLEPVERAALAEALTGNMSTHVVYAVRAAELPPLPDGLALSAVPVMREGSGADLVRYIRPDGTIPFLFDGLRVPVALPSLAAAILRLIDGERTVGDIGAELGSRVGPDAFERAWRETYTPFSALNRILLVPPP